MRDTDITADVLVIGCGIAGASAALEAAKAGCASPSSPSPRTRRIPTPIMPRAASSPWDPDDDPELLKDDIITSRRRHQRPRGRGHPGRRRPASSSRRSSSASSRSRSREARPDKLDYAQEAGHSRRRILHVEDATGRTIEERFLAALGAHAERSRFFTDHTAVDLLTVPHHSKNPIAYYHAPRCVGAYVLDNATGRVKTIFASRHHPGHGRLRRRLPPHVEPAGRHRRGLRHGPAGRGPHRQHGIHPVPPDVALPPDGDGFLISETVRGEGARLKTRDGRTFMESTAPSGTWRPRDEVSRAIYEEMINDELEPRPARPGLLRQDRHQEEIPDDLQDLPRVRHRHHPRAHPGRPGRPLLLRRRPRRRLGPDFARGPLRGRGGRLHRRPRRQPPGLDLAPRGPGLGDAGGPRHRRPVRPGSLPYKASDIHHWYYPEKEEEIDPALINQDWLTIRSTMWNYAGIIRTRKRLERAKSDLEYLRHRIEQFYQEARMDAKVVGLKHGIQVALMITHAALANPVSRGAHFIGKTAEGPIPRPFPAEWREKEIVL